MWSEKQFAKIGLNANYALALDEKRIAAVMSAEGPEDQKAENRVIFLQNFSDELRLRVPLTGK